MRSGRRQAADAETVAAGSGDSLRGGSARLRVLRGRGRVRRAASGPALSCPRAGGCLTQRAVAGLSIGMILTDPRGKVMWMNRAAERLFELTSESSLGQRITQVLRDPELRRVWELGACSDGNCMADISVNWPRKLDLKLNLTDCRTPSGEMLGRAMLFCDVTDERSVRVEMTHAVARRLLDLTGTTAEAPAAVADLTPQELRTLRLLGRGMPNPGIAAELSVERSTVRSYLKSIYRKLGLRSRAAAIRFAIHQRLE